ncbi:response regulator [Paenibacillus aceris]|uniref:Two-component system response regulator YesN n=2 Tax=Paenibacillus aceris TaxID=869555 RepID=A0ABS4I292_9BACL|nr:two-component system response regulator YesN [Paenibacillus aceris]NHW35686.1 response regulator [Paenibacillus aceris]
MIRMLIVDDEEIITDGLFDVFSQLNMDLDLYKAYSGEEALDWMNKTRVDIVLSDIRMPGMDGLELMKSIRSTWLHCKIIFLTGFNDFDYIYEAIQTQGVSYLLKSEGYDRIIKVVTDAIHELENSLKFHHLIQQSREKLTTLETLAQGNYFRYLLQGERSMEELEVDFRKLGIALDPSLPVLVAVGDLQRMDLHQSFAESQETALAVKFLAETFLAERTNSLGIIDRYGGLVWLIQPTNGNGMGSGEGCARTVKFLEGQFELMQQACMESMGHTFAITLCADPCEWIQLNDVYDRVRSQQYWRAGDGVQMVQTVNFERVETAAHSRTLREKADSLAMYLEGGGREGFLHLFNELKETGFDERGNGGPFLLELYYTIALLLLSYINRWELHEKVGTTGLMQRDMHKSWQDNFKFLQNIAESLFDLRLSVERNRAAAAIEKVRSYIDEHIGEDLSLVRLASVIHFNPSYLSRLFKQESGVNLSEYIDEVRVEKAKDLLKQDVLKIAEVGVQVGYEAPHSFTRFFKKSTGVTPLEYREMIWK